MYLLIGGLGDSRYSLLPWIQRLKWLNIPYLFLEYDVVSGKTPFSSRVKFLSDAVKTCPERVTIIGHSAGGLAGLIVASELPNKVDGVIAVSPAMPRGISPLGEPLIPIMKKHFWKMLRSKLITVSEEDYTALALNGVLAYPDVILQNRKPISGKEAFELASPWHQPKLGKVTVTTVLVFGNDDRWVSPDAHLQLAMKLYTNNNHLSVHEVHMAGHLPVHCLGGQEVVLQVLSKMRART
ncbi:MAG: alpha/beta fold hydrolase [Minisyncoccota bacterium]